MPRSDREARQKDAEWSGRDDYSPSLWYPDGIERDQIRLGRGIAVIRSNPAWLMGICLNRAAFMLSYNDSRAREFPFNTAQAPRVFAESAYGHALETKTDAQAASWGTTPAVLVLNGSIIPRTLALTTNRNPLASISPGELSQGGAVLYRNKQRFLCGIRAGSFNLRGITGIWRSIRITCNFRQEEYRLCAGTPGQYAQG